MPRTGRRKHTDPAELVVGPADRLAAKNIQERLAGLRAVQERRVLAEPLRQLLAFRQRLEHLLPGGTVAAAHRSANARLIGQCIPRPGVCRQGIEPRKLVESIGQSAQCTIRRFVYCRVGQAPRRPTTLQQRWVCAVLDPPYAVCHAIQQPLGPRGICKPRITASARPAARPSHATSPGEK